MTRLQTRLANFYQRLRVAKFRLLSDCQRVSGHPTIRQPVQLVGLGSIRFNGRVILGWYPSPHFFSGYIYIEARCPTSVIQIEDGVAISNNSFLISDGPGIFIGKRTMLGTHCEIIDSDFHDLHPDRRSDGVAKTGKVVIGENVLIGSNSKILKGVRIGNNAVIANGSVVTRSIPENAIAFGNPARAGFGLIPEEAVASRSRVATFS
jgi:acetyltransferase-like isoleucine patch superfamily enzyme